MVGVPRRLHLEVNEVDLLREVNAKITNIDTKMDAKFTKMDAKFQAWIQRWMLIPSMDAKIDVLGMKPDGFEKEVHAKFTSIDKKIESLGVKVDGMNSKFEVFNVKHDGLVKNVVKMDEHVNVVGMKLDSTATSVSEAKTKVDLIYTLVGLAAGIGAVWNANKVFESFLYQFFCVELLILVKNCKSYVFYIKHWTSCL